MTESRIQVHRAVRGQHNDLSDGTLRSVILAWWLTSLRALRMTEGILPASSGVD